MYFRQSLERGETPIEKGSARDWFAIPFGRYLNLHCHDPFSPEARIDSQQPTETPDDQARADQQHYRECNLGDNQQRRSLADSFSGADPARRYQSSRRILSRNR